MIKFSKFVNEEKTLKVNVSDLIGTYSDGQEQENDDFFYFIDSLKQYGLKDKDWSYADDSIIEIPTKFKKYTKSWSVSLTEGADVGSLPAESVAKVVDSINKNFGKTNKLVRKDDPIWMDTDDAKEIFIDVSKPPRGWLMKLAAALEKGGMKEKILDKDYNELEFETEEFTVSASKRGKTIEMVFLPSLKFLKKLKK